MTITTKKKATAKKPPPPHPRRTGRKFSRSLTATTKTKAGKKHLPALENRIVGSLTAGELLAFLREGLADMRDQTTEKPIQAMTGKEFVAHLCKGAKEGFELDIPPRELDQRLEKNLFEDWRL